MEKELDFSTTAEIAIPNTLVEQVIGQDRAVEIVKRAARQKRHLLLIGPPGIGKSMLAQAMSELLPVEELEDILAYPNSVMENEPIIRSIRTYPDWEYLKKNPHFIRYYNAQELNTIRFLSESKNYSGMVDKLGDGLGRRIVFNNTKQFKDEPKRLSRNILLLAFALIGLGILFAPFENDLKWLAVALLFGIGVFYMLSGIADGFNRMPMQGGEIKPKLVVDNTRKKKAPFIDGTGAKAGALLGDVKHDPLQSGGLGTPAHLRVEAGAIHKANKGILFIDEMASLKINWQQELLTAMQEKKYSITGQSELSSGALVKTTPAASDFVLVAAGNMNDLKMIHPALRSRIRGSGYEVYMKDDMEDTRENREKIVRLVAQEIAKDNNKIPHFTKSAVLEIIAEAKRIAGKKNRLTLRLRELGGLIRASGDLAVERQSKVVEKEHVEEARTYYKIIESQAADVVLERKKEYQVFKNSGFEIGRINGLAVLGESAKGIVLPIVADVTPSASEVEGKTIATGKLGKIAKEAVNNVSALVKKTIKADLTKKDTHIQFIQTYEGVEGDSASIAVAVAVLSAMEQIPINQGVAVTGSIDIRGSVLPVGGVSSKIEAAIETGIKKIIVPSKNLQDISISSEKLKGIEIIGVENIEQALEHLLKETREKRRLLKLFSI